MVVGVFITRFALVFPTVTVALPGAMVRVGSVVVPCVSMGMSITLHANVFVESLCRVVIIVFLTVAVLLGQL